MDFKKLSFTTLWSEDAEIEIENIRSTNPQAAQVLHDGREKVEFHFELNELLKLPMQHILRYPLTVKRLAEKSGESHCDYRDLMEVLSDLEDLNKLGCLIVSQ